MTLEDLVIIDWLSPEAHSNFDRAFIEAISDRFYRMYTYAPSGALFEHEKVINLGRPKSRWEQALAVRQLVSSKAKNRPILLLSYDALYVPLLKSSFSRILAYEHNTTPERAAVKHMLWQKAFMGRLRRLAQFPQQLDRLTQLDLNGAYIGSPLTQFPALPARPNTAPPVYLLPSIRSNQNALLPYLKNFEGSEILCKNAGEDLITAGLGAGVMIRSQAHLEFHRDGYLVDGVIISLPASVRGSGWVNDAIGHGVPVISVTDGDSKLIARTFPKLDFVDLTQTGTGPEFDGAIARARIQRHQALIARNNLDLKNRLEEEVTGLWARRH